MADPMRGRDPRLTTAVQPGAANALDVDEFVRRMLASEQLPMTAPQPAPAGPPHAAGGAMTSAAPGQRTSAWSGPVGRPPRRVPPRDRMGLR